MREENNNSHRLSPPHPEEDAEGVPSSFCEEHIREEKERKRKRKKKRKKRGVEISKQSEGVAQHRVKETAVVVMMRRGAFIHKQSTHSRDACAAKRRRERGVKGWRGEGEEGGAHGATTTVTGKEIEKEKE